MTARRGDWVNRLLLFGIVSLVALAAVLAGLGYGRSDTTDALTVERNGYLHGVRHADRVVTDGATSGWPQDEAGVRASCVRWIDDRARGFDRDAFLAGCADAVEVPR